MLEKLFDNLIVVFVLGGLFILAYCRLRNKTLLDVIKEINEALTEIREE